MSLQFNEISLSEWNGLAEEKRLSGLFYQSEFHAIISSAYHKTCTYFAVKDDANVLIALPIYHKQKDASLITHFFYQVIYFDKNLSERKKIEAFNFLATSLIEKFNKIDLKLDPEIFDIRAFVWNGFENNTYYSYHINTASELNYSENIKRQLKKSYQSYKVELSTKWNDEVIGIQLGDMEKNGLSQKESSQVRHWLKSCSEQNLLDLFILKNNNDEVVGSAVYLRSLTFAYLIAVMSEQSSQAMLYDKAIEHYKQNNVLDLDLLGANLPNIAIYKSQFDSKLISYHIVSYRRNRTWELIKKTIKSKIKSIYK